jgi:heat shock transcription factor
MSSSTPEEKATIKPDTKPTTGLKSLPFPLKLHSMLSDDSISHIISWNEKGTAWKIHEPTLFTNDVVPKYFSKCKYTSFLRMSCGWGFKRILDLSSDHGCYSSPHFTRERPELIKNMKREQPLKTNDNRADISSARNANSMFSETVDYGAPVSLMGRPMLARNNLQVKKQNVGHPPVSSHQYVGHPASHVVGETNCRQNANRVYSPSMNMGNRYPHVGQRKVNDPHGEAQQQDWHRFEQQRNQPLPLSHNHHLFGHSMFPVSMDPRTTFMMGQDHYHRPYSHNMNMTPHHVISNSDHGYIRQNARRFVNEGMMQGNGGVLPDYNMTTVQFSTRPVSREMLSQENGSVEK